jgi:multidrug transporter EmrE-like cation transporter
VAIVFAVLFEVYKDDFERWLKPVSDWLKVRESWSWTIPTAILVILSFPPLFGHEIVQLIVGLAYPLGVALGIACAGAVIGEAACL